LTNEIGGEVSHRKAQGRDYIVAPMVAVVSKVLNGWYLPAEEIQASILGWNGVPLTHNHPEEGSARDPDIQILGRFYNAQFEDNALKGEAWYDVAMLEAHGEVGEEIRNRLLNNETIEVSTGYYAEIDFTDGEYDNEHYWGIQRNLTPDHIATLPHDIGACSIDDGCGTPRRNSEQNPVVADKKIFVQTHEGEKSMGKTKFKAGALVTFLNAALKAVGAEPMDADKLKLNSEEEIEVDAEIEAEPAAAPVTEPVADEDEDDDEPAAEVELPSEVTALAQMVKEAGGIGAVTAALKAITASHKNERDVILRDLKNCKGCPFTQEELEKLDTPMLRKLSMSMTGVDYSLNGGAAPRNLENQNKKGNPMPPVLLAKKEAK
jgi:hypothetical protein